MQKHQTMPLQQQYIISYFVRLCCYYCYDRRWIRLRCRKRHGNVPCSIPGGEKSLENQPNRTGRIAPKNYSVMPFNQKRQNMCRVMIDVAAEWRTSTTCRLCKKRKRWTSIEEVLLGTTQSSSVSQGWVSIGEAQSCLVRAPARWPTEGQWIPCWARLKPEVVTPLLLLPCGQTGWCSRRWRCCCCLYWHARSRGRGTRCCCCCTGLPSTRIASAACCTSCTSMSLRGWLAPSSWVLLARVVGMSGNLSTWWGCLALSDSRGRQ